MCTLVQLRSHAPLLKFGMESGVLPRTMWISKCMWKAVEEGEGGSMGNCHQLSTKLSFSFSIILV